MSIQFVVFGENSGMDDQAPASISWVITGVLVRIWRIRLNPA
jgi:hypothetical protein